MNAANTAIEYYLLSVGYWIFTETANNQYPTQNIQKTQQIPLLNITYFDSLCDAVFMLCEKIAKSSSVSDKTLSS